jgi:hypothetical protein
VVRKTSSLATTGSFISERPLEPEPSLIAADFFTTEVLSWNGLVTYYTLFVIELRTRCVQMCGTTLSPNAE